MVFPRAFTSKAGRKAALMLIAHFFLCWHALYLLLFANNQQFSPVLSQHHNSITFFEQSSSGFKSKRTDQVRYKKFHFQPLRNTRLAIFYNIFIPTDQGAEGEQRARDILQDQLGQIGASYAVANGTVSLYYVTIGKPLDQDDYDYMKSLCDRNHLECHHIQHFKRGYEEVTLQRVHEFCVAYPEFRAMYIHSKGSYHAMEKVDISQTSWRRNMMSAVTHQQCIEPPDPSCTACGLVALPWPMVHFAGNFFTAQCQYVSKLIPPRDFSERMGEAVSFSRLRMLQNTFVSELFEQAMHYYGVGRFASEQWVGSHPAIVPCDLSPRGHIKPWYQPGPAQHPFQFAMFPRHPIQHDEWPYIYKRKLKLQMNNPSARFREYFLLPGNLFRWYHLYNQAPPESSWIWSWFPDGLTWKQQTKEHGKNGVDILTAEYAEKSFQADNHPWITPL